MKKLAIGMLALMLMGGVAYAELSGDAEAHVWVDVLPNIAVGIANPEVDIGSVQMGEFEAVITFRIDANTQEVNIMIIATDLYKGDVPTSAYKIPVLRGLDTGAVVEPALGNATGGHANFLEWLTGHAAYANGMTASESETADFTSGQNGHFSQDVVVKITYDQIDPELPQGEYSGFVKMVATITP